MTRRIWPTALLLVQRVASAGTPIVVSVLVARAGRTADFGTFAVVVALVGGAQIFVEFGLDKLLPRQFVVESSGESVRRWISFKQSISAFCYVGAITAAAVTTADGALVAAVGGLVILTHAPASTVRSWLLARHRLQTAALAAMLGSVLTLAVAARLVDMGSPLVAIAAALPIGALLELAVLIRPMGLGMLRPIRHDVRAHLAQAWPFAAQTSLSVVYTRIAIVILSATAGAAGVASFAMAANLYTATAMVPTAAALVSYPQLAAMVQGGIGAAELPAFVRRQMALLMLLVIPVSVGFIAVPEAILSLIYGHTDTAGVAALRVVAVALLFVTLNSLIAIVFFAVAAERRLVKLSVLTVSAATALALLLVPRWGPVGAALSVAGSDLITALVLLPDMTRQLRRVSGGGSGH